MTALQLEPSAQAPCTSTIFGSVFISSLPFARRTSTASQIWKRLFLRFLSRNSTLYFSKVPSLHFLLLLSHQWNLQIGGPVFRLVKSTTVHVFAPIKKHAVVDIDEVVVDIGLSLDKAKQRKGFSCDVLHDIDFPRVEASTWKSVRDSGKALMQWSHLIRFIGNVIKVVRALCNRVLSLPGVMPFNHNFHQRHFSIGIGIIHHGTGKSVTRGIRKNA